MSKKILAAFGSAFAAWVTGLASGGTTDAMADYEYACSLPERVGMNGDEAQYLLDAARQDAISGVHDFRRCVEIRCERWARTGARS